DPGVLGRHPTPVEPERHRRGPRGELDIPAAVALGHRQPALGIALLGRLDLVDAEQHHEVLDRAGGRAAVLLLLGRDLPERAVGRLHHGAVPPEVLLPRLDDGGSRRDGGVDVAVHIAGLRDDQGEHEAAEPGGGGIAGPHPYPVAEAEGGVEEALCGGGVLDLEHDVVDSGLICGDVHVHDARRTPGRRASRFLTGCRPAARRDPAHCGRPDRKARPSGRITLPPVRVLADTTPLRNADYRRLWTSGIVTTIGAQLSVVAVPQQIFQITGSSGYVGLAGLFGLVPLIVFGLWGGALADVMDRRVLLLITTTGTGLTALAFWAQAAAGL